MPNQYNNKVILTNSDGETSEVLMDISSDTATAGDVLEGRTLHLASGAPATGTYRPSEEIEARLEATVGHSEETNLFVQQFRQGTSANTSTATAVCSLTVIPVEYEQTLYFHNENTAFSFRVYGTNDEGKASILAGGTLDQAHRLYEGSYVYTPNLKLKNEVQGVTCYVIMVRKPNFPLEPSVTYQNITPSDIPQNMIWVTNEQRTDDRIVDLEARVSALEAIISNNS